MSAYATMSGLFPSFTEKTCYSFSTQKGFSASSLAACSADGSITGCGVDDLPEVEVMVLEAYFDPQMLISCPATASASSKKCQKRGFNGRMKNHRIRSRSAMVKSMQNTMDKTKHEDEDDDQQLADASILFDLSVYAYNKNAKITRSLSDIRDLWHELEKEMSYRRLDPHFCTRPVTVLPTLPDMPRNHSISGSGFIAMRRGMMKYAPLVTRWFREVLQVVHLDESPNLTEFFTEGLWEMKLGRCTLDHNPTLPSALDAIAECGDWNENEQEDDDDDEGNEVS